MDIHLHMNRTHVSMSHSCLHMKLQELRHICRQTQQQTFLLCGIGYATQSNLCRTTKCSLILSCIASVFVYCNSSTNPSHGAEGEAAVLTYGQQGLVVADVLGGERRTHAEAEGGQGQTGQQPCQQELQLHLLLGGGGGGRP